MFAIGILIGVILGIGGVMFWQYISGGFDASYDRTDGDE
jgi:hypothetical protein